MQDKSKLLDVKASIPTLQPVSVFPSTAQYLRGRFLFGETVNQVGWGCWSAECELLLREFFEKTAEVGDIVAVLHDAEGEVAGLRLWPIPTYAGRRTKRLAMELGDGSQKGKILCNPAALRWLRGEFQPAEILFFEGESDFLTGVQVWGGREDVAIVGIGSGWWGSEFGAKVGGARVVLRIDADGPGDTYAKKIYSTLPEGCEVWRYQEPDAERPKPRDQNKLLCEGLLGEGVSTLALCARWTPPPEVEAPAPAPASEGSKRGESFGDEDGWRLCRAALWWAEKWAAVLVLAQGPGGTHHDKKGWATQGFICLRAAHGLQARAHRVTEAQKEKVEGSALALLTLEPSSMEADLEKAAMVGAGADEATQANRKGRIESDAKKAAKDPMDMDGLCRRIDDKPELKKEKKPKKEKAPKLTRAEKKRAIKAEVLAELPPLPAARAVGAAPSAPPPMDPAASVAGGDVGGEAWARGWAEYAWAREVAQAELWAQLDGRAGWMPHSTQNRAPRAAATAPTNGPDWRQHLSLSAEGDIKGSLHNAMLILRNDPRVKGALRLNAFLGQLEVWGSPPWANVPNGTPFEDVHITLLINWIAAEYGADVQQNVMLAVMRAVGAENRYDSLEDYFDRLKWDGVARLDTWLERYCGVRLDLDVAAFAGRKWMIAAVARALSPGCQSDYSLILEGDQGCGKSQALVALAPSPDWHTVLDADPGGKDALENMQGKWLIELAELAILSRGRDARIVKGFLTKMSDRYRESYGVVSKDRPRRCIFFGTVNPEGAGDYLTDPTGNRRWWPVRCGSRIDLAGLRRDRDQLWAEAAELYRLGVEYHPTEDERARLKEVQDARTSSHPWTFTLRTWLSETTLGKHEGIHISKIIDTALHIEPGKQTKADQQGAALVLRAAGWERKPQGKFREWVWFKPEGGAATAPPAAPPKTPTQGHLGSIAHAPKAAPPVPAPVEDDEDTCPF